jgi:hypothetical protein
MANAPILKQPAKPANALNLYIRKPGPAVPGLYPVLGYLDRGDVGFGLADSGDYRFGGAIKDGKGNFAVVAIFDNKDGPQRRRTVPEMFNDKEFKGKIVPYRELGPFFTEDLLWDANKKTLIAASPMVTSTFGIASEIPLGSLQTTKQGNIIIAGEFYGTTRYEGPTVDQLRKAGIKVEVAGVFLATETGYQIVDANKNGDSYVIKSILKPEEIKTSLLAFYGQFGNGQRRKTDNPLGIPVGDIA